LAALSFCRDENIVTKKNNDYDLRYLSRCISNLMLSEVNRFNDSCSLRKNVKSSLAGIEDGETLYERLSGFGAENDLRWSAERKICDVHGFPYDVSFIENGDGFFVVITAIGEDHDFGTDDDFSIKQRLL